MLGALMCGTILADRPTLPILRDLEVELWMRLNHSMGTYALSNIGDGLVMDVARLVLMGVTADQRSIFVLLIFQTDFPIRE